MLVTIILTIVGFIVGAFGTDEEIAGALIGALAGLAGGGAWLARKQQKQLRRRLVALEDKFATLQSEALPPVPRPAPGAEPEPAPASEGMAAAPVESPPAAGETPAVTGVPVLAEAGPASRRAADSAPSAVEPAPPIAARPPARKPDPIAAAVAAAKSYLFGGNTVVRVGILVLIAGVGLLGKWAADNDYFPAEARLILAAVIGLALIVIGWRLREKRRGYSISLQGGGVGIVYMTVFLALRLYDFIPAPLAFALLVALAVFSQLLAVLQDAKAMAVLGVIGGFLAPIMASTGEGRYVILFSYYTILNIGILGVAWFKAWRLLNWLGFLFTFGVAGAWIIDRHQAENFASTEPFLIIFFVIYVAIPVLFAWRQPPKLRGLVDGSIVFGTPIAAFALQGVLVEGERFGMALSSFAAAVFYIGLASWLFARAPKTMRNMTEALLALGVIFGTLAIPFALDDQRTTGATWALEGAGLFWLGVRQKRWLSRLAGILLQIAAAVAFANGDSSDGWPFLNSRYLGCLMIALGGWFIAWYGYRQRERVHLVEVLAGHALLLWGLCWWLVGGGIEIDDLLSGDTAITGVFGLFVFTAVVFELIGRGWRYPPGRYVALAYLPVAWIFLPVTGAAFDHPFGDFAFVPWLVGFVAYTLILYRQDGQTKKGLLAVCQSGVFWLLTWVLTWEAVWLIDRVIQVHRNWELAAIQMGPALALAFLLVLQKRSSWWPVGSHRLSFLLLTAPVLVLALICLALGFNLNVAGDADPLPYLPVANPLDLAMAFAFVAILSWYATVRTLSHTVVRRPSRLVFIWVISATIFLWLNAVLVRTVHQYADVPFRDSALFDSTVLQTSLSIFWTLLALLSMVVSTKKGFRTLWIVAAVVLGIVVIKLVAVDLSFLGTGLRIVSFLVVGALLVLGGYLSPIPPEKKPTNPGVGEQT